MTDLYGGVGDQQQKPRPKRPTREQAAAPVTQSESQPVEPVSEAATDEAITALVAAETGENPVAVFTDKARFDHLFGKVATELRQHVPDVTTDKGRRAIAANAFRAVKVKTTLDRYRKGLTEEARQLVTTVNEAGKEMAEELDALARELRQPLTDWEEAEAKRTEANQATVAEIRAAMIVTEEDTSATVEARGRRIHEMTFAAPQWTDAEREIAEEHQADAVASLLASRARLAKQEKDAAELEQLRAQAEERAKKDQHDAYIESLFQHIRDCGIGIIGGQPYPYPIIIRELTEKVVIDEEWGDRADEGRKLLDETIARVQEVHDKAEAQRREQVEREEADRVAAAAQRAADEAREAAEAAARAEQEAKDREAEEKLAEQRRIADEAAAEATRLREAAAEAQRVREQEAEAQRLREQNRRHRQNIETKMQKALLAIEGAELTIEQADAVVRALVEDRIPHTKVTF